MSEIFFTPRVTWQYIVIAFVSVLSVFLTSSPWAHSYLIVNDILPNVPIIFVVYLAFVYPSRYGLPACVFVGFFSDSLSNDPTGFYLLSFFISFSAACFFRTILSPRDPGVQLLVLILVLITKSIVEMILTAIFFEIGSGLALIIKFGLPEIIYTSLVALFLYPILNFIYID